MRPLFGVFFCLVVINQADGQSLPTRLVVDTRAVCHDSPAQQSAAQRGKLFGRNIVTTRDVDADGAQWYFADQYSIPTHACWVYGPYTTESRPHSVPSGPYTKEDSIRDMEADWLAVLDHLLARTDADFEEYVEVDNGLTAITPLLQFRRLQILDRAGGVASQDDQLYDSPLKLAWLISHLEKDPFGGDWFVPPQKYWDLFDANRYAPWAEEVAWTAEQIDIPRDECFADCMLNVLVQQPLQYWKRLPAGAHIHETLVQGAEYAKAAAETACMDLDPAQPGKQSLFALSPEIVAEIRAGLADVSGVEKGEILKVLDDADRKCAK
jgi:hypothetical protein